MKDEVLEWQVPVSPAWRALRGARHSVGAQAAPWTSHPDLGARE